MNLTVRSSLVAAVLGAAPLTAQVAGPAAVTITGTVVDSLTGKPLRGAEFYFNRETERHRAGRDGRIVVVRPVSESDVLVVRVIGYVPRLFSLGTGSVDLGTIALRPVATQLDRIAVEAEEVRLFPYMEGFFRRKTEGVQGQFITRADIDRSGARQTSEMLRRSNKVQIECDVNVIRSGDECVAKSRRYRDIRPSTSQQPCQGEMCLDKCPLEIFVDGRRSTLKVDEVPLSLVRGIEIYSGPSTTPAMYGRGICGVVGIWTNASTGN